MAQVTLAGDRRTSVDDIFDHLHKKIVKLELKPGDRISEAEIAALFGVSRQPVRDAFSRLANLDLLLIRPQRATEVRRFSMRQIEKARFVRASVEKEVVLRAAQNCDATGAAQLDAALLLQGAAVESGDVATFGKLDFDFHKTICSIAKADYAFEVIQHEKAKIDRLCILGREKEQRLPLLAEDHRIIAEAIKSHDAETAIDASVTHLSRLDQTIERITAINANYFEPTDL
ncbi:MAG: GntR family transcriptional regulator [Pseudomonadota bacterium]